MEAIAETAEGKQILQIAYENNTMNITQRLVPRGSGDDPEGAYLVMLLDWPNSTIIRLVFTGDEIIKLTAALNSLAGMKVLDGFDETGATKQ